MNGYLKIKTSIDNTGVDKQITQLENKLNDLKATLKMADSDKTLFSESEVIDMEAEVEKLNNSLTKLKAKQQQIDAGNWDNIRKGIDGANKGITKAIKNVGRWVLGVFAIESAYGFVRSSITTLSQQNEQIATDLEYMRYAIASALQPLIQNIIQLAYKLLSLVNSISMAWFGFNLFANASVDSFNKIENSAKSIKKSLAGFDEMNIIGDSSTSGGTTGGTTPSLDLSQTINKEQASSFWSDIFGFWEEDWEEWFIGVEGNWGTFIEGLGTTLKGFYDVFKGVFEAIGGLINIFVGIFTGDIEKIAQGWNQMCQGLKDIIVGVLEIIGGLFLTFAGAIKGIFLDIWDGIKAIFKPVGEFFKGVFDKAYKSITTVFKNIGSFFSGIYNTVVGIFKKIGTTIGNVVGSAFKGAINGALTLVEGILNAPINAINGLLDVINAVPGISLSKLNTLKLPRLASGGIVNNPGHGVMMGNYIAGEAGREGVLPLTNPQTMAMLGQEIGKWITSNNSINVYLDGRLIQRQQDRVREELAFATNGR